MKRSMCVFLFLISLVTITIPTVNAYSYDSFFDHDYKDDHDDTYVNYINNQHNFYEYENYNYKFNLIKPCITIYNLIVNQDFNYFTNVIKQNFTFVTSPSWPH